MFLDFAGRGFRQFLDEDKLARRFEARDTFSDKASKRVGRDHPLSMSTTAATTFSP